MCELDSIIVIVFLASATLVKTQLQTWSQTYPEVFKSGEGEKVGSGLKSSGLTLKILAFLENQRKHILKCGQFRLVCGVGGLPQNTDDGELTLRGVNKPQNGQKGQVKPLSLG